MAPKNSFSKVEIPAAEVQKVADWTRLNFAEEGYNSEIGGLIFCIDKTLTFQAKISGEHQFDGTPCVRTHNFFKIMKSLPQIAGFFHTHPPIHTDIYTVTYDPTIAEKSGHIYGFSPEDWEFMFRLEIDHLFLSNYGMHDPLYFGLGFYQSLEHNESRTADVEFRFRVLELPSESQFREILEETFQKDVILLLKETLSESEMNLFNTAQKIMNQLFLTTDSYTEFYSQYLQKEERIFDEYGNEVC